MNLRIEKFIIRAGMGRIAVLKMDSILSECAHIKFFFRLADSYFFHYHLVSENRKKIVIRAGMGRMAVLKIPRQCK